MIKIFLFAFNRPDLLEIQVNSLKKFIQDDIKITVVQDRHNNLYDEQFQDICNNLNIPLIIHKSKENNFPSQYHADSIQYVYEKFLDEGDLVLFLDHDMFAIDNIELNKEIESYDIVGPYQSRGNVKYIWPGIMLFRYDSLKNVKFNFSPQIYKNEMLDTGGGTYRLFESNLRIRNIPIEYPETYDEIVLDSYEYPFELYLDQKFLHMRNASHWNNNFQIDNLEKTKVLKQIIESIYE